MNITESTKIIAQIAADRMAGKKSNIAIVAAILQLLDYRRNWKKRDLDYTPPGVTSSLFVSARKAAALIDDGKTVMSTGIAGHSRCSIYYWAIRDRVATSGHPQNLTWVSAGSVGGRGKAPGTIEELNLPGLITQHIVGHCEPHKALLKLADEGQLELHTMPIGLISLLLEAQADGTETLTSQVGLGTFLDPRVGSGSKVSPGAKNQYIEVSGAGLRYRLPPLEVAIFSAPYADPEGNIYFKHAATLTESIVAVKAARRNRGIVLATVCDIIPKNAAEISLPHAMVDAIVVNPRNEQTAGILQRKYFPLFTEGAQVDIVDAYRLIKLINTFMGITPYRGPVEEAISRMASSLFVREVRPGAIINIGIGLPEEVSRLLFESGLYRELTFTSESGVYGGLPTSGMYFGAAINPQRVESSSWMFHQYDQRLDIGVLGFLEVDSQGNVNVSKRGPRMLDYVGPGGFPNICSCAKKLIFVGSWTDGGDYLIKEGRLQIRRQGRAKFVDKVDQITFNARQALADGKTVYYVTTVGIFRLTERGLQLEQVMSGVDIQKDVLAACSAEIYLPPHDDVKVVTEEIVTGKGFSLRW